MAISYITPLERAWARTRQILFESFQPERWLVIGFASFLAGLAGSWAGMGFSPGRGFSFTSNLRELQLTPKDLLEHAFYNSVWFLGFPWGVVAVVIGVALLWISSRGKFVFLDNVCQGRGAIVDPWRRYSRLGDSLFLWRLGFTLALLVALGFALSPMIVIGRTARGVGFLEALSSMSMFLTSVVIGILAGFIALFLEGFVVPLMYKRGLGAMQAWGALLPLLRRHPADFFLLGILVMIAWVVVAACVLVVGLGTCCLLFFVLSVPYVNSVVLLPLATVFRLYTLEFLEQYGPDYAVLPRTPPADSAPPPPQAPSTPEGPAPEG